MVHIFLRQFEGRSPLGKMVVNQIEKVPLAHPGHRSSIIHRLPRGPVAHQSHILCWLHSHRRVQSHAVVGSWGALCLSLQLAKIMRPTDAWESWLIVSEGDLTWLWTSITLTPAGKGVFLSLLPRDSMSKTFWWLTRRIPYLWKNMEFASRT